jgi:hypothetical protein
VENKEKRTSTRPAKGVSGNSRLNVCCNIINDRHKHAIQNISVILYHSLLRNHTALQDTAALAATEDNGNLAAGSLGSLGLWQSWRIS